MKKIAFISIVVLLFSVSCNSLKKTAKTETEYQKTLTTDAPAKVFSVPDMKSESKTAEEATNIDPIAVRKEVVTFTEQEDVSANENNTYFIIVGSFSSNENAINYRQTLISEGFTPIILHSETTGYYRVCVNSFNNESESRARVHQIRQDFPQYYDSWLLVKQ